jgi:hypothetical protein
MDKKQAHKEFLEALTRMQAALKTTLSQFEKAFGEAFLALDVLDPPVMDGCYKIRTLPDRWYITWQLNIALTCVRLGRFDQSLEYLSATRREFVKRFTVQH